MQLLSEFFNGAEAGLGHILVDALPEEVIVIFVIDGPGGGTWSVRRFGPTVSVRPEAAPLWDCRLSCTTDDFQRLLSGELSSRIGFGSGRLRIEGDVGLVIRLEKAVLRRARLK